MFKSSLFLSAMLLASACASMPSQAQVQSIVPEKMQSYYDNYHFSPAVRVGDMVILSGVVAALEEGETEADMAAAFERAFQDIDMVLKAADADWADIVEIETYHTELLAQIETFSRVKDKWIKEPYPAWTALDIDSLFRPTGLVEIKVTAYSPK